MTEAFLTSSEFENIQEAQGPYLNTSDYRNEDENLVQNEILDNKSKKIKKVSKGGKGPGRPKKDQSEKASGKNEAKKSSRQHPRQEGTARLGRPDKKTVDTSLQDLENKLIECEVNMTRFLAEKGVKQKDEKQKKKKLEQQYRSIIQIKYEDIKLDLQENLNSNQMVILWNKFKVQFKILQDEIIKAQEDPEDPMGKEFVLQSPEHFIHEDLNAKQTQQIDFIKVLAIYLAYVCKYIEDEKFFEDILQLFQKVLAYYINQITFKNENQLELINLDDFIQAQPQDQLSQNDQELIEKLNNRIKASANYINAKKDWILKFILILANENDVQGFSFLDN